MSRHIYDTLTNRGRDFIRRNFRPAPKIQPKEPPAEIPEVCLKSPIFIIGVARSGTTLLSHLLQLHPSLLRTSGIPDGEDTAMWVQYASAKIAGIGSSRAHQAIGFSVCESMSEEDITGERRRWLRYHLWKKYQRNNPDKHILNKNPHLSNKLGFVQKIFPEAYFIHLIRDPGATVASLRKMFLDHQNIVPELSDDAVPCWNIYTKKTFNKTNHDRMNRVFTGENIELLIEHWYKINHGILEQEKKYPDPKIMTVQYEELVRNPGRVLNEIYSFCGLQNHIKTISPLDTSRIDGWKSTLGENKIADLREWLSTVPTLFDYRLE